MEEIKFNKRVAADMVIGYINYIIKYDNVRVYCENMEDKWKQIKHIKRDGALVTFFDPTLEMHLPCGGFLSDWDTKNPVEDLLKYFRIRKK